MKKAKIGFWILMVAFLLLLGFQNKSFFIQKNAFGLNLYVTDAYMTPEVYNGVAFAVCFLAGLVIAYFSGLFERFRTNKTIKQLNADIERQRKETEALNIELNALKSASSPRPDTAAEDKGSANAAATQVIS
ncbi:MAG: LapA family protein [Desulfosarcina sp.]|nr:LapA family protein [Desulfobacterales bacterium]